MGYKNPATKKAYDEEYMTRPGVRERRREIHRKYRYGLTPEQHQDMVDRFGGMCHSCRAKPATHVDHDHSCCPPRLKGCGECVRGVLCHNCNTILGMAEDDVAMLHLAINYLEENNRGVA